MLKAFFSLTPFKIIFLVIFVFVIPFAIFQTTKIDFLNFEKIENFEFDLKLRSKKMLPPDARVAVIEINEPSLAEIGRFPFSRFIFADFLMRLKEAGVRVAAFDMVFAEAEGLNTFQELKQVESELPEQFKNSKPGQEFLEKLKVQIEKSNSDAFFAKALAESIPVTLGYAFDDIVQGRFKENINSKESAAKLDLLKKHAPIGVVNLSWNQIISTYGRGFGLIMPIPELFIEGNNSTGVGFFNGSFDSETVIRNPPMLLENNGIVVGSLSLMAVSQYLNEVPKIFPGYKIKFVKSGLEVPLLDDGTMYANYYGEERSIKYYEFVDVLKNKNNILSELKDKIVFVGATAQGLKDIRATPLSKMYPGVEVHATVASNILQQNFLSEKNDIFFFVGFLSLAFIGGLLAFAQFRFSPLVGGVATIAIIAAHWIVSLEFFNRGYHIPFFYSCIEFVVLFFVATLYRYYSAEKEQRFIKDAFSRYVSKAVVQEIIKDHDKLKIGGQKKNLTVLFADMVGFTKMSEKMSAEQLTGMLNEFFTRMTAIILNQRGTLDKYMGDAIMCFWGAPLDDADHASLACTAALEMIAELKKINEEWSKKYGITISMRIGINSGDMSVGNMGSEQVFSYTVMGDNVNLGSRLEGVNNVYGTKILIGEQTYENIKDKFFIRKVDQVAVKGRDHPVFIYELLSKAGVMNPAISTFIQNYDRAFDAYQKQDWLSAKKFFEACLQSQADDRASKVLLERVEQFSVSPPKDWDGVHRLESK